MKPKKFGIGQFAIQPTLVFIGIGGLFTLLAAKVAFVRQFPLPFDEGFHFGLIKVYAHHLNPFLSGQPQGADAFGAVARDPSYLYHYLLSFPYRLIALLIPGETGQVIALRCLNIALGLATLYLVYRLAKRCGLSDIGAGLVSLALAVTPVFYDLSAQINYDNLLIPLTLLSILSAITITEQFRKRQVSAVQIGLLTSLILLTSLVKYSYLPIGLAIAGYVIVSGLRNLGFGVFAKLGHALNVLQPLAKVALVALVIISTGLWAQRYVVNMAEYHTPHPQCDAVLSVASCSNYGPWERNYQLHESRAQRPLDNGQIVSFSKYWFRNMYIQVYATIRTTPSTMVYSLNTEARMIAKVVLVGAVACAFMALRLLARQRSTWVFFGVVGAGYLATLWLQNYSDYHNLHTFVAIQGRYLLLVLPMVYIVAVASYESFAERLLSFETAKLQAKLSSLIVVGWLGLRAMRRVGQVALERVVNFNWNQLVPHSNNPVSEFAADPWLGDITPSFR